jgi:hypothetical protein
MGTLTDKWARWQELYKEAKSELSTWYSANSTDSGHEDYIDPEDFATITTMIQLGDDVHDWYRLFLKWRNAGTESAKNAALSELETHQTAIYNQFGLDEDDLAVVQLITAGLLSIIDEKQEIINKFGT